MSLEAFQTWVVQTGVMVSLLIVIILLIRRPFARAFGAHAAYALWTLPLIRLCLPGFSVPQNWVPGFLRRTQEAPVAPTPDIPVTPVPPLPGEPSAFLSPPLAAPEPVQWSAVIICAWLSVAVLWLAFQLIRQRRFKSERMQHSSRPLSDLAREIGKAAETVRLTRVPVVRIADDITGPLVTGVLRPLVILPNNFNEIYDEEQRQFALVHEFAHIKRRDLWAALATLVFRAVNWPNPLVHYASHKLRADQEAACDAFVVKVTGGETAHSYAETLVKAVRQDGDGAKKSASLALSLTQADSDISKGD